MRCCHYIFTVCIIFPLRSNKLIVHGGLVLFKDGVTVTLPLVPVQSESDSRLIVKHPVISIVTESRLVNVESIHEP